MRNILFIVIVTLLALSCKQMEYIPLKGEDRVNTVYKDRLIRDSIFHRDSIIIYMKGDTVFKTKWRDIYKEVVRRDTINTTDTIKISIPYPVEKKLNKWQKLKVDWGGWAIILMFSILIIPSLPKIIRWLRRFM